jgi:hypothetical protein
MPASAPDTFAASGETVVNLSAATGEAVVNLSAATFYAQEPRYKRHSYSFTD